MQIKLFNYVRIQYFIYRKVSFKLIMCGNMAFIAISGAKNISFVTLV